VKLGFADGVGTQEDATHMAAEMAGLGDDYEVVEPPKKRMGIMSLLGRGDDDDWEGVVKRVLKTQLMNKPLYLMPGSWE
jgi:hypothetical protein